MNINLDISKNIWDVGVDKAQITQALSAIVAYPSRLPHKPAISVHARNLSQNREVEIVVTAHDLVLDEQAIKKLMEPDFETKDALELDLSIADFIISRHEGQLKIESSAGLGTNFVVRLKRASPDSKNRMVGTALGKHVLWMEDETLLRELNSNFLEALGHQGDMAPEGSVALNLFKEALRVNRPYDLVILDLVVPNGMGGMETYKELKALDPTVRIIVCSGYSSDPVMSDWRNIGFAGVLPKPYSIDELGRAIDSVAS
jgi:CheY-like chemotaxis protein